MPKNEKVIRQIARTWDRQLWGFYDLQNEAISGIAPGGNYRIVRGKRLPKSRLDWRAKARVLQRSKQEIFQR